MDTPSVTAHIALGSNLGDRSANIERSLAALDGLDAVSVVRVSAVIETDPVGPPGQGPYLNAAAALRTSLEPMHLLLAMLDIERAQGRDRSTEQRWGPRPIDLDLILFGDRRVNVPGLTVPHPRLAERRFVLEPLAEIAPEVHVPGLGATVAELLARLPLDQAVDRAQTPML